VSNGLLSPDDMMMQGVATGGSLLSDDPNFQRMTFLPFGFDRRLSPMERLKNLEFAVPGAVLGAVESAQIPGRVLSGEYGVAGIENPAFMDAATQFSMDYGMLPAVGGAVLAPATQNTLRMGAVPRSAKEIKDPMIVLHNIHEEPLKTASRRGGIPVPSLAITKADDPLTKFGEISLIGDPSMAVPGARNPIWKTDAYTIRQPRVETTPDAKSIKFVDETYAPVMEKMGYADPKDIAETILTQDEMYYDKFLRAAYLKSKGDPLDFKGMSGYDAELYIREKTMSDPEFYRWFAKQREDLLNAGGGFEERIFLGYTPSGKRKYAPATLENIVKEMKGRGAGSEGLSGTFGSLRARIAEKFPTQSEIKKSRGLLGTTDDYQKIYDETQQKYFDLLWDIGKKTGLRDDGAGDVLEYLMVGGGPQLRNFAKQYADELGDFVKEEAVALRDEMRKLPTQYFEIKPQRAVSLSEFKGAIVPSNVEQSTLDAIRDAGITDIKFYKTQEERAKLVGEFGDQFFTVPNIPVPASGILSDEQNQQQGILY